MTTIAMMIFIIIIIIIIRIIRIRIITSAASDILTSMFNFCAFLLQLLTSGGGLVL